MGSTREAKLAIVGAGRLGRALTAAFNKAGVGVAGPLRRGATLPSTEGVLLCVPDREVGKAAAAVPPGPLVGHCAGALNLGVLGSHEGFSFHPLLPVSGDATDFRGAVCAVAGTTDRAQQFATRLATVLGMEAIAVAESSRDAYHAAASLASNYLVTLEDAAELVAASAGLERRHLVQLARAALDSWARSGGAAALTGPIVRGDADTVRRQRAAILREHPELLELWDALTARTRMLAAERPAS